MVKALIFPVGSLQGRIHNAEHMSNHSWTMGYVKEGERCDITCEALRSLSRDVMEVELEEIGTVKDGFVFHGNIVAKGRDGTVYFVETKLVSSKTLDSSPQTAP